MALQSIVTSILNISTYRKRQNLHSIINNTSFKVEISYSGWYTKEMFRLICVDH